MSYKGANFCDFLLVIYTQDYFLKSLHQIISFLD